jgi:hypothetical protein
LAGNRPHALTGRQTLTADFEQFVNFQANSEKFDAAHL